MDTGFYENIPMQTYHKDPAYSRSDLVLVKDFSPAHYKAKEEFKETPAMIFGSACHMACLEPDLFPTKYSVMPEDLNLRTKDGKAFKAMADEKGKTLLSASDGDKIFAMQKKLLAHPLSKRYLNNGKFEISGFFKDPNYHLPCKVRFDYFIPPKIVVDYKTARDAREWPFTGMAFNSRYHVQSAWYSFALSCIDRDVNFFDVDFIFVVQEKEPPYEIMVYEAGEEFKREGMHFCESALKIIDTCQEHNNWPGYDPLVTSLDLPEWKKRQLEYGIYE